MDLWDLWVEQFPPEKLPKPNRKVFQPSIFPGAFGVSFRDGYTTLEKMNGWNPKMVIVRF